MDWVFEMDFQEAYALSNMGLLKCNKNYKED
jgi:hypothetical protein